MMSISIKTILMLMHALAVAVADVAEMLVAFCLCCAELCCAVLCFAPVLPCPALPCPALPCPARLTSRVISWPQGWQQVQYMSGKFPWWVRPLTMRAMRVRIHDRIHLQVSSPFSISITHLQLVLAAASASQPAYHPESIACSEPAHRANLN